MFRWRTHTWDDHGLKGTLDEHGIGKLVHWNWGCSIRQSQKMFSNGEWSRITGINFKIKGLNISWPSNTRFIHGFMDHRRYRMVKNGKTLQICNDRLMDSSPCKKKLRNNPNKIVSNFEPQCRAIDFSLICKIYPDPIDLKSTQRKTITSTVINKSVYCNQFPLKP